MKTILIDLHNALGIDIPDKGPIMEKMLPAINAGLHEILCEHYGGQAANIVEPDRYFPIQAFAFGRNIGQAAMLAITGYRAANSPAHTASQSSDKFFIINKSDGKISITGVFSDEIKQAIMACPDDWAVLSITETQT